MAENDQPHEQPAELTQPGAVVSPGDNTPAEPPTPFEFHADGSQPTSNIPTGLREPNEEPDSGEVVTWTASEFIAHEKEASWYFALAAAAVLIAAVIYILTRDYISSGVVLIGALFLGIMAARKPKQLQYQIDSHGISIGQRRFSYEEFRSFSVVPEGAFSSIVLLPLKRFATLTTIYYAPEDEDKIVNLLSSRLPFDEHHMDAVDRLMRRIRF